MTTSSDRPKRTPKSLNATTLSSKYIESRASIMSKAASALKFRRKFTFATKDVTHWFPGHMMKGMKQMQSKLQDVDLIVEIHDARIPFSGRNPKFRDTLLVRPHLFILNKMDLADLSNKDQIEEQLRKEGVENVMYTNSKDGHNKTIMKEIVPAFKKLIESEDRYNRAQEVDFNLMILGVPNVGKSSFINAIRQTQLKKGGKATSVGAVPGITRSVLERIRVCNRPKIYVFDTPGIMNPNIKDVEVGMKLALCANLKDHLVGPDVIVDYMLYWLNKHKQFDYVDHFKLSAPTDDVTLFLAHVAKEQGYIEKRKAVVGGYMYRWNFDAASAIALRAFREGKLGKVMLDTNYIHSKVT
ncbi:unnamed protein product [Owenia fusiformis]|uniref:Uncharacterized protein n=1 Tax=Owenia fusiformis TaxID=6347 RepID=A0A8J1Y015_OWEFU|nr:unnamed protein product [Owenia fusiformis]